MNIIEVHCKLMLVQHGVPDTCMTKQSMSTIYIASAYQPVTRRKLCHKDIYVTTVTSVQLLENVTSDRTF